MYWIDGHLDLAYLAVCGRDMLTELAPAARDGCITLPALQRSNVKTVFATIFTEPNKSGAMQPYMYPAEDELAAEFVGMNQLAIYEQWQGLGFINIVHELADLYQPGINCVLLMEGADPIRSPQHVPEWYQRGVRIVGLTWATGSRYAGGNSSATGKGPLTPLGIELVRALDEANIIHDASHLSDAAFDGLMENARGRVIASHSNCRALVEPKQRHLRDDQIKEIGDRGGVIGLNLHSPFLSVNSKATIDDCVAHVERVTEIMGHRRGVALGSDMDGGFGPDQLPIDLDHPSKLVNLADALRNRNWPNDDIIGFASGNWLRILAQSNNQTS